jgi:hypothetical protein
VSIFAKLKAIFMAMSVGTLAVLAALLHHKGKQQGLQQGQELARQELGQDHAQLIKKLETVQEAKREIHAENVAAKLNDFFK